MATSGGFTIALEDRSGQDVEFLAKNLNAFLAPARKRPEIGFISTTFLPGIPQNFVDVDRDKVLKQGVPLSDVYFNRFGRHWQVYVEAETPYRATLTDFNDFCVAQRQRGYGAAFGAHALRNVVRA